VERVGGRGLQRRDAEAQGKKSFYAGERVNAEMQGVIFFTQRRKGAEGFFDFF